MQWWGRRTKIEEQMFPHMKYSSYHYSCNNRIVIEIVGDTINVLARASGESAASSPKNISLNNCYT